MGEVRIQTLGCMVIVNKHCGDGGPCRSGRHNKYQLLYKRFRTASFDDVMIQTGKT